jgi:hypothetical protein
MELNIQELIDSGQAWRLEGSIGRQCMAAIENGDAVLGKVAHTDYWGNRVPGRHEVVSGTVGSLEFAGLSLWDCDCPECLRLQREAP